MSSSAVPIHDVDDLVELYSAWGERRYDEVVTQLDHALQCAAIAARDSESDAFVAAALLHDVGHLLWMAAQDDASVPSFDTRHEDLGADALASLFGADVVEPIRLHVEAKRVLMSTDDEYESRLSPGSVASAARQGGPATADEVDAFRERRWSTEALRLRRIDDAGKVVGLEVAPFERYVPMLRSLASEVIDDT